jgi:hypothetical protein
MAGFAPELQPINPPDWTNVTRPISQPLADESKGIALKTIGEGISGAVNTVETGVEDFLKDRVRSGVEAIRDTTTLAYQNIRNAQVTGQNPNPQAVQTAGFNGSLVPPGTTEIPEALQSGLDRAGRLAAAKAQGKANDTLYTAALNSMSKELRSQFPGHRDFIDEQISRISGINPANAYMQNLLTDINRNSVQSDNFQKQVISLASKHLGDPEVQKWWVANQQGVPNAFQGLQSSAFKAESRYYQHEGWKMDRETNQGNQQDSADLAQRQFEVRSQQTVQDHLNPIIDIPGLTQPMKMSDLIQKAQHGDVTLTGPQWEQLQQNIQAAKRQAYDHLTAIASGEGYARTINNPGQVSAIIDRNMGVFDRMLSAVTDKNIGTMYETQRMNNLSLDQSKKQAYDSNIGEWLRQREILNQSLGPNWMNVVDSASLTRGQTLQDLQRFYSEATAAASSSPDMRKTQNVQSLYDSLQAAKKAKADGYKVPDRAYDNLVENVDLIQKALDQRRPDIAKNVVDYMFDPAKNEKLMNFWGRDFTDNNGVYHKGKFAVYDTLSSPKIVDAVNKVGDAESWNKFRNWQEMSFKTLFAGEAKNLSDQSDNLPYNITWDSDKHRLGFQPIPGAKITPAQQGIAENVMGRTINALNGGLQNLSYMHSKEGADTNEYLFDTLMEMGYNPGDKLKGDLPQKVMDAIKASQMQPKSPADRLKETFERVQ